MQRRTGNLDVFPMIDGEVVSMSRASSQWRDSQDICNELECLSIPGKDHRARSRKTLGLRDDQRFTSLLARLVLNKAIGPRDADCVGVHVAVGSKSKRH